MIGKALMSLRPGAQWTIINDDVENITWHTEGVEPLTQAEVDAEMVRLEQQAIDDAAQREAEEAAREDAINYVKSLAETVDEKADADHTHPAPDLSDVVAGLSGTGMGLWIGSQADYDAIDNKSNSILYVVI